MDALRAKHNIQSETVVKRPGEFGRFTGREGREAGFVKYLAADRTTLAKALSLPAGAVEEDPSLGGHWRPIQVSLKGPINAAQVSRVQRIIEDRMRDDEVNFVCLRIDSPGGDLSESVTLANFLAEPGPRAVCAPWRTSPKKPWPTRLWWPWRATNWSCTREPCLAGPAAEFIGPEEIKLVTDTVRENLAKKKEQSWSMTVALIDPNMTVYRYTQRDTGQVAYFCEAEAAEQPDRDKWNRGEVITENGQPLQLSGAAAEKFGVARHIVKDFGEFKELYGLENDVALVEPGWADYLIDALASPAVAWVLAARRRSGVFRRTARARGRHRRLRGRSLLPAVFLEPGIWTARPAGWRRYCFWPASAACCSRSSSCPARGCSAWAAGCWSSAR